MNNTNNLSTRYQHQLNHIFNRPVTQPEWYWTPHEEAGVFDDDDPMTAFLFIETLLQDIKTDLQPYSDDQIALGLEFVFNNAISNLSIDFKNAPVPHERKVSALQSLFAMFRDVFEPRCTPKTSAGAKETVSKLNNICYMFWDVSPLSNWLKLTNAEDINLTFMTTLEASDIANMQLPEQVKALMLEQMAKAKSVKTKTPEENYMDMQQQYRDADAETKAYYRAVAEVMEHCLSLNNPSCIESGLHGLGHLATFQPHLAVPIIDRFLKNRKKLDPPLRRYAEEARTGMIL